MAFGGGSARDVSTPLPSHWASSSSSSSTSSSLSASSPMAYAIPTRSTTVYGDFHLAHSVAHTTVLHVVSPVTLSITTP